MVTLLLMKMPLLEQVTFLQKLDAEDLHLFAELLELREYPPRRRIIQEGQEMDAMYLVVRGTVHVRRMAQKREVMLGRIPTGGFLGEVNLFESGRATASIYAMDEVELASISYAEMRSFMESHPAAGYHMVSSLMGEMAKRLRQTNDRLVNAVYWTSLSPTP